MTPEVKPSSEPKGAREAAEKFCWEWRGHDPRNLSDGLPPPPSSRDRERASAWLSRYYPGFAGDVDVDGLAGLLAEVRSEEREACARACIEERDSVENVSDGDEGYRAACLVLANTFRAESVQGEGPGSNPALESSRRPGARLPGPAPSEPVSTSPRVSDAELPRWIEAAQKAGGGVPYREVDGIPYASCGTPYFGAAVFDLADARSSLSRVKDQLKLKAIELQTSIDSQIRHAVARQKAEARAERLAEALRNWLDTHNLGLRAKPCDCLHCRVTRALLDPGVPPAQEVKGDHGAMDSEVR